MTYTEADGSDSDLGELDQPDGAGITEFEQRDLLQVESTPATVSYSGQDFDVDGLVRRLARGDILIPTFGHNDSRISSAGFQRSFVWTKPQMDRFIESLLLGYPIPGIFLVRQADRRYLVLDGQQRLRTLQYFYKGMHEDKLFQLANVSPDFRGLTYESLTEEQRLLIDNTFLQATIVATDGSAGSLDAIYQIFERLNSGGTQLTPHEIRVALFAGPFIDYLERLNGHPSWRSLYGQRSPRLRDQELLLRILALYVTAPAYKRPLKTFLNNFVGQYRDLAKLPDDSLRDRFFGACDLLNEAVGRNGLTRQGYQVNAALTEAIFVGLMRRLGHETLPESAGIRFALDALRDDPSFQSSISRSTADEENVRTRLDLATVRLAQT